MTISQVSKYSDESDPDKVANDKDLAAKIMVLGMRDGLFTGAGFSAGELKIAVSENNPNFIEARRIINRLNEAQKISDQADVYLAALRHKERK